MKKIIKYSSYFDFYKEIITPAKNIIPDWYKETKNVFLIESTKNSKYFLKDENKNFKLCMPFLDSFSSGYLVLCPFDIVVSHDKDNNLLVEWKTGEHFIGYRENSTVPVPAGYHSQNFIWIFPAAIKVPKGYSALITHPLNRFDLPFLTLSGVIDGGYAMGQGNYPFFIKNGFNGVIKQGTPIAQIIPYKTDSWKSEDDKNLLNEAKLNNKKAASVFFGWYKNIFWKRKHYE